MWLDFMGPDMYNNYWNAVLDIISSSPATVTNVAPEQCAVRNQNTMSLLCGLQPALTLSANTIKKLIKKMNRLY